VAFGLLGSSGIVYEPTLAVEFESGVVEPVGDTNGSAFGSIGTADPGCFYPEVSS
jgi:hypothetical protein